MGYEVCLCGGIIIWLPLCFCVFKLWRKRKANEQKKNQEKRKKIERKVKRRKRRGPSGATVWILYKCTYEYLTICVLYVVWSSSMHPHRWEEEEKEVDVGRRRRRHRASVVAAKIEGGLGMKLSSKFSISVQKFFSKDYWICLFISFLWEIRNWNLSSFGLLVEFCRFVVPKRVCDALRNRTRGKVVIVVVVAVF